MTRYPTRKALLLLAVGALGVSVLPGWTNAARADRAAREQSIALQPHPTHSWLVAASALVRLEPVIGPTRLRAYFDSPRTLVIVGKSPPAFLVDWRSPWALSFASYAAMRSRLSTEPLDPHVQAVVYDDEAWPLSPRAEQRDPVRYTAMAAALAHQYHLILVATPATNLATVESLHATEKYSAFLQLEIAQQVARYADVYEIQAQGSEANQAHYRNFVARAATQAREGNPVVDVLAGLSSNPVGQRISAQALYRDELSTRKVVSEYWLNIPGASVYCPKCGVPQPQIAAQLLALLSGS